VRTKVEHPFLVLKRLWGFAKVRYRGLAKNAHQAFAMLALINLNQWGRPLTGEVHPCSKKRRRNTPHPASKDHLSDENPIVYLYVMISPQPPPNLASI
jgi:IS5 family transposase